MNSIYNLTSDISQMLSGLEFLFWGNLIFIDWCRLVQATTLLKTDVSEGKKKNVQPLGPWIAVIQRQTRREVIFSPECITGIFPTQMEFVNIDVRDQVRFLGQYLRRHKLAQIPVMCVSDQSERVDWCGSTYCPCICCSNRGWNEECS